jgi:hypothetical protein
MKSGMVVHACNLSTWRLREHNGQHRLHKEFKASLDYIMRLSQKTKQQKATMRDHYTLIRINKIQMLVKRQRNKSSHWGRNTTWYIYCDRRFVSFLQNQNMQVLLPCDPAVTGGMWYSLSFWPNFAVNLKLFKK